MILAFPPSVLHSTPLTMAVLVPTTYVAMKCHSLALHLPMYDLPPSGLLYGVEADIKAGVKELINALGLE